MINDRTYTTEELISNLEQFLSAYEAAADKALDLNDMARFDHYAGKYHETKRLLDEMRSL